MSLMSHNKSCTNVLNIDPCAIDKWSLADGSEHFLYKIPARVINLRLHGSLNEKSTGTYRVWLGLDKTFVDGAAVFVESAFK